MPSGCSTDELPALPDPMPALHPLASDMPNPVSHQTACLESRYSSTTEILASYGLCPADMDLEMITDETAMQEAEDNTEERLEEQTQLA